MLESNRKVSTDTIKKNVEEIELRNVEYSYCVDDRELIHRYSMQIKKNEILGIMGPSGSGKTTLVDIITGLLSPDNGELLVNGKELHSEVEKEEWMNTVGYAGQDTFIAHATIAQNIALGVEPEDIDFERLKWAAKLACVDDFLSSSFQSKLDTMIGGNASSLSGGQRQRIGIARAIYMGEKIYIFDEATSSLDYQTEAQILKNLREI